MDICTLYIRIQPGAGDVSRTSLGWNPETLVVGFPLDSYFSKL